MAPKIILLWLNGIATNNGSTNRLRRLLGKRFTLKSSGNTVYTNENRVTTTISTTRP
jgi:hypothetical protein